MSVRTGDRKEGKLDVLRLATELCAYTLGLCKNEKVFPKSNRWILTQKISNECVDALACIRRANATLITGGEEGKDLFRYRYMQQAEAHAHLGALYALADIAYAMCPVGDRISHWVKLIAETDDKLKAWMRANTIMYAEKQKNEKRGCPCEPGTGGSGLPTRMPTTSAT